MENKSQEILMGDSVRLTQEFYNSEESKKYSDIIISFLKDTIIGKVIMVGKYSGGEALVEFYPKISFMIPLQYLEKVIINETVEITKEQLIHIVEMAFAEGRQRFWKPGDSAEVINDWKNSYTYRDFLDLCKKLKINYERK